MKKIIILLVLIAFGIPSPIYAARLWSTGAELQSVTNGVEWDTNTGTPALDTTTFRSGVVSLRINTAGTARLITHRFRADTGNKVFIRAYIYIATAPSVITTIIRYGDGSFYTAQIRLNNDRTLELWSDSAQIGSDSSALSLNTWYRIELVYDDSIADNTTWGYIDGTQFATGTGADLANGGVVGVGIITATTADVYFDDIAVNDTSGSAQTGLPGAGSIVHMHPTAAGDAAATTGIFSAIDDVLPNDAVDYIEVDTIKEVDYNFETSANAGIGASDTITLVQVGTRQHPETAEAAGWRALVMTQTGGTTAYGTGKTHNDTAWRTNGDAVPRVYSLTSYVDPQAGGAWTPALLDTMQAGVDVTDATPNMFFSTIWALVEYVPSEVQGDITSSPMCLINNGLFILNGRLIIQ